MYALFGCHTRRRFLVPITAAVLTASCCLSLAVAVAQDEVAKEAPAADAKAAYTPAIELLPDSAAGLVRIANLPSLCEAWKQTNAGKLFEEPVMQPFIEAQRARAKNYLESIDNKVGIRLDDLYAIASGEVVFAWLPFENDKRRPYALCVVADTRGKKGEADKALATLDQDLTAGGWVRRDVQHRGQTVRIYDTKPKPGQLKVEQIAITQSGERVIAADRDSVVIDLLDAIAGQPKGKSISTSETFKTVLTRCSQAIRPAVADSGGTIAVEWFAKPFQMGRIVRESLEVDRGTQVDVLKLLQNQGFDAIKGAGGIAVVAGQKYDLLHKGYVLAPAKTSEPSKYEKAARMLQFVNQPLAAIPAWIHQDAASVNRLNLRIEEAFWSSESLVNEAFGDEIFREIFEGIRDDEDGPQIDVEKNVLPNLDDQIILVTDNTLPADVQSERMLVAIRVRDAAAIKTAIRKAMEVEPDASKMDVLPGVEIWRVQRGQGTDDFDADLFGDLGLEEEPTDEKPPLLDHWAIALVEQGPGSDAPYLMFSSHPELLVETAKRVQQGAQGGVGTLPQIGQVMDAIKQLDGKTPAFDRMVRTKLSMRTRYELLRQGKLKDSDSVLAKMYRRIFEDEEGGQPDPLNAAKLPPMSEIEQYFPAGGSSFETTEDGWAMTGFFLK